MDENASVPWTRKLIRILLSLAILYGLLGLAVYFGSNYLVFIPEKYVPGPEWTPPAGVSDVSFLTDDNVRLHGWWRAADKPVATILVLYGNAGNLSGRRHLFSDLQAIRANVLIIDYRGYGKSEGSPDEAGLYRDAEAAWRFVVHEKGVKPQDLIVLGQSLGGGVACELSSRREIRGLILEAPFTSVPDMASGIVPFPLLGWAMGVRMDNCAKVRRLQIPILIFHGDRDRVIPIGMGRKLFDCAGGQKKMVVIPGGGHNDLWEIGKDRYLAEIQSLLDGT